MRVRRDTSDVTLPLLLLDVDGVLMPLGRSVPPGFERHTTVTSDVVVSAQHGEWLRELMGSFELVWASTWGLKGERLGWQDPRAASPLCCHPVGTTS